MKDGCSTYCKPWKTGLRDIWSLRQYNRASCSIWSGRYKPEPTLSKSCVKPTLRKQTLTSVNTTKSLSQSERCSRNIDRSWVCRQKLSRIYKGYRSKAFRTLLSRFQTNSQTRSIRIRLLAALWMSPLRTSDKRSMAFISNQIRRKCRGL